MSSCSLGIATLSYLDHLEQHGDPMAKATRDQTRAQGQQWIRYSEFEPSLDNAFRIWDAVSWQCLLGSPMNVLTNLQVYDGVKTAGSLVKEREMWDDTNEWLAQRR